MNKTETLSFSEFTGQLRRLTLNKQSQHEGSRPSLIANFRTLGKETASQSKLSINIF